MKDSLPKGWVLSPIGELYDFIGGGTPDKKTPIYWGGEVPWATVKDIKGKYLSDTIDYITEDGLKHSAATLASEGELILVTRISPGLSIIAKNRIAINQDLKTVKHYAGMPSEFSFYYFISIEKKIREISSGTTVSGIRLNILREITAAVPPLPEQHRIVAKIEQLFSELDKGVAELKKARETLALYRQSLLKAAFEGRLTEKWRRERADELESADQLLARIKAEREKHYRQQVADWKQAAKDWEAQGKPGRKSAKPRKPKELKPLTKEDVAYFPELPEGWGWVTIEDLCPIDRMISYGVLQPGAHIDNGVRLIRVGDIDNGKIDSANLKRIGHDISERYKKTILHGRELLITVVGAIGRTAVVSNDLAGANVARAVAVVPLTKCVNENFIELNFRLLSKKQELESKSHEVARKTLNLEDVRNVKIAIAPYSEQVKIVERIEANFSILDHLTQNIDNAIAQADLLRQSILQKAFTGKLVPQDPNDEPASELLKRIQAERDKAAREKKTTRKTPSKREKRQMADLLTALKQSDDWISAQEAFRQCGISDGAETEQVEALYMELRDLEKAGKVDIERRGQEDWLKLQATREAQGAS